jgi:hypothetical protein
LDQHQSLVNTLEDQIRCMTESTQSLQATHTNDLALLKTDHDAHVKQLEAQLKRTHAELESANEELAVSHFF